MDNVSHTLIGLLVGETAARLVKAVPGGLPDKTRRNIAVPLLALGSNFPDSDLFVTTAMGGTLDYVLHHRGHTHTLVGALLGGVLLYGIVSGWLRFRKAQLAAADHLFIAGIAILGPLLHLALDYTNSYGVHPFWPFDNRWVYGDTVFIIEPLLWVAATPLVFLLRTLIARIAIALLMVAAIGLAFGSGFVPPSLAIGLTVLVLILSIIARYAPPGIALASGIAAWLGTTGMFFGASYAAESELDAAIATHLPTSITLDHVLTPMPVNPFCWEVMTAQVDGEVYAVRKAVLSLAPEWFAPATCPTRDLGTTSTAPLVPVPATFQSPSVLWSGELSMPVGLMSELADQSCAAAALLKFARIPWAAPTPGGWIVGDLRYDREPELGMAEVAISTHSYAQSDTDCPMLLPPWIEPRRDLLDLGKR